MIIMRLRKDIAIITIWDIFHLVLFSTNFVNPQPFSPNPFVLSVMSKSMKCNGLVSSRPIQSHKLPM